MNNSSYALVVFFLMFGVFLGVSCHILKHWESMQANWMLLVRKKK